MTVDLDAVNAALDTLMQSARIPRATYRLQFSADFTFQDALALVPYLEMLGISDIYASPLFKPRPGSTHGYDTVDYNQFNAVLGTEEDFDTLTSDLQGRGMGLLLDIVPNHMGVSTENTWWTDVLKEGPSSQYAHYFDINWRPQNRALDNKVLLPVLGDHYGQVLEAGELKIVYWHGDFYVHYYEHQFPMTPESYRRVLRLLLDTLPEDMDEDEAWVRLELASVVRSLDLLPPYFRTNAEEVAIRRRESIIVRWRLLGMFDKSERFRTAMQETLDTVNGDPADPASFDMLDDLLSEQPYRLSYWRVATDEINYRRFFDINDMAAVRIEAPDVFDDVHRLVFRLMAQGKVSGLRIDHPDGLWDPNGYFWSLQSGYLQAALHERLGDGSDYSAQTADRLEALRQTPDAWTEWPLYVLVEKILSESEPLPESWAVHGTTGYDFMYAVNNLFVNQANEAAFDALYTDFIGEPIDINQLARDMKQLVMSQSLTSELDARSSELARIVEQNRRYRGFTQNSLAFGLSEFTAALDIYRTYITGPGSISERDRLYIEAAIDRAKASNPLTPSSLFDFLRETMLMQNFAEFAETQRADLREFVMHFQQITGPVMAKSMEDTAFYIFNRLTSLNEVGGHLDRFGTTVDEFHTHNEEKAYTYSMLSTSTHDTKRSEDVRARINVLSEIPDEWREMVNRWAAQNAAHKTEVNGMAAPSANDEYLLYQTLLGTHQPGVDDDDTYRGRIIQYMHKAINEAKTYSNWVNPNEAYAQAIADFLNGIWASTEFHASFDPFRDRVAFFGWLNSLAQTLLKLTSPGMPDIYQGNELWNYSLVDPDNRRPIDFAHRQTLLEAIKADETEDRLALAHRLLQEAESGAIKLYLTYRTLNYRRDHAALFRDGAYTRVVVEGARAEHVCAFVRHDKDHAVLVIVPRLVVGLTNGQQRAPVGDIWGDTRLILPEAARAADLTNILTGARVQPEGDRLPVTQALDVLPVGLFAVG
ncbi:MAG: malto-oligosyltrehalose synthase [Chloroflexota bacterium]